MKMFHLPRIKIYGSLCSQVTDQKIFFLDTRCTLRNDFEANFDQVKSMVYEQRSIFKNIYFFTENKNISINISSSHSITLANSRKNPYAFYSLFFRKPATKRATDSFDGIKLSWGVIPLGK